MMAKKSTAAAVSVVIALAGCSTDLNNKAKAALDDVPTQHLTQTLNDKPLRGTSKDIKAQGDSIRNLAVVRQSTSPWIGGAMVPTTKEDALPAMFNEAYGFDFGEGRVSLQTVAARLTKMTGVPVRIRPDVNVPRVGGAPAPAAPSTGSALPMPMPLAGKNVPTSIPSNAVSSNDTISLDALNMRWNGKLKDFLDHMTNSLSLAWEYRDGAVVIMRLVTQSHSIAILPGAQKYSTSVGTTASGSSQTNTQNSSQQSKGEFSDVGQIDALTAISDSIKAMIAQVPGSTLVINAQTGVVNVTTSKEVQAQIRDYLDQENARLRQIINVTLDIYTIKTTDADTQSLNWNAMFQNLSGSLGGSIVSPASLSSASAGAITLTKLTGVGNGSAVVLNALRSTGNSVTHRPISLTTMNGKQKIQTGTNTQAYVKETTPGVASASGSAGAPGLKTDTLVTGDVFAVLPVIQPDNSIILKYSFNLSNLTGLNTFTSGTGSSAQTIQVPTTDAVSDGADLRLQAGESFLITGLSRLTTSDDNARLSEGAPILLGGSNKKSVMREHFIVLVRATPL